MKMPETSDTGPTPVPTPTEGATRPAPSDPSSVEQLNAQIAELKQRIDDHFASLRGEATK
ncbi:hypothetical protein AB0I22_24210 [Streptomyces sp. NPDC050610]|uniref:hypothetical protein n=1 Tax=Streptomyces sp. NPDC050610 TaxID=3157097 RepID=UPI0034399BCD